MCPAFAWNGRGTNIRGKSLLAESMTICHLFTDIFCCYVCLCVHGFALRVQHEEKKKELLSHIAVIKSQTTRRQSHYRNNVLHILCKYNLSAPRAW